MVAARISEANRISFWDAMIVQSAWALGCGHLVETEDLNYGQVINGVSVSNPFRR